MFAHSYEKVYYFCTFFSNEYFFNKNINIMKRFLPIFCALFLFAGNHAAQASDSVTVKNLSYAFVNTNNLPVTITDSLISSTPLLKDMFKGHVAKGYSLTFTQAQLLHVKTRSNLMTEFFPEFFLLDEQFNEVKEYRKDPLYAYVEAGSYYLIVTDQSSGKPDPSDHQWYEMTISTISNKCDFAHLTYIPVTLPAALTDTLTEKSPVLTEARIASHAKGYSFQGVKDSYVEITMKSGLDEYLFLLDANYRIIASNDDDVLTDCRLVHQLPANGTYYVVATTYSAERTGTFHLSIHQFSSLPVYYIDAINGSDTATGASASAPLLTLDTAIHRSEGIGIYYLMEDYTFGNNDNNSLYLTFGKLYPYEKDIKLSIHPDMSDAIFEISGTMIFGEAGGRHFFLMDSIHNPYGDILLDGEYNLGSYVEVNNTKITNCHFDDLFYADSLVIRNCTFTCDTVDEFFYGGAIRICNSTLSNNWIDDFVSMDDWYLSKPVFRMEGGQISGNNFLSGIGFYNTTLELVSGEYKNNRSGYSSSLNLSMVNAGGMTAYNSTVCIGAGFTMDANNYLLLDSTSVIRISENLSNSLVAQVLPIKADNEGNPSLGYANGRRILEGSNELLAANYQKFNIAQLDTKVWYLRPDGKIYDTEVAVKEAGETVCRIYPNPTQGMARITLNQEVTELRITDMQGKVLHRQEVNGEEAALNLQSYANGMYFIQFRNGQQVIGLQKVIKQ